MTTIFLLLLGIGAMLFFALLVTNQIWLLALLRVLASHNFLVTNVEENTGKVIMRNGKVWRCITNNRTRDPDPRANWNMPAQPVPRSQRLMNAAGEENWLVDLIDQHLPGGMRWIGLNFLGYSLYWYNFRWSVLRESKPTDEDGLVGSRELDNGKWVASFAKRIDYIYLRDAVYYFEVINAQTTGSMPTENENPVSLSVNVSVVATIRIINFYHALFVVHDWLETIFDLIRPTLRSWIAHKNYQEVVSKPEAAQQEYDVFLNLVEVPPDKVSLDAQPKSLLVYLEDSYGVKVKRLAFDDVMAPDEYVKATNKRAEAEQDAIRIQTLAGAEKKRIITIAEGQAEATKLAANAFKAGGEAAVVARTIQALEMTHPIIAGGQPVTLLVDAAKGAGPLVRNGVKEKDQG